MDGQDLAPDRAVARVATIDEIDARTLYELLRIRGDVFIVEQDCAFADLDGRDLEPTARHLWLEYPDGTIGGYARLLDDPDGVTQIGRVVTPAHTRGTGAGARLMREALSRARGQVVLKAQARLSEWYGQFGFAIAGDEFIEDGIPHVPMRLHRDGPMRLHRDGPMRLHRDGPMRLEHEGPA